MTFMGHLRGNKHLTTLVKILKKKTLNITALNVEKACSSLNVDNLN
jgi:hypothetical protein